MSSSKTVLLGVRICCTECRENSRAPFQMVFSSCVKISLGRLCCGIFYHTVFRREFLLANLCHHRQGVKPSGVLTAGVTCTKHHHHQLKLVTRRAASLEQLSRAENLDNEEIALSLINTTCKSNGEKEWDRKHTCAFYHQNTIKSCECRDGFFAKIRYIRKVNFTVLNQKTLKVMQVMHRHVKKLGCQLMNLQ